MAFKKIKADGGKSADFDPKAEAVRLYREGLSARAVAERLSLDPTVVKVAVRKAGVVRSRSAAAALPANITERALRAFDSNVKLAQIAKDLGVAEETVRRVVKRAGRTPRRQQPRTSVSRDTPAELVYLAVKRYLSGESSNSVAEAFGVSGNTVLAWVTKSGGQVRTKGETFRIEADRKSAKKYEKALALRASGLSQVQIAIKLGVSQSAVSLWLKRPQSRLGSNSQESPTNA